jgi:hypothetical protein
MIERALAEDYARLPPAVQRFHRLQGRHVLQGWVQTQAPATRLAHALARLLGTPRRACTGRLRFELEAGPDTETWIRCFPGDTTMRSQLRRAGGEIEERLGPARLVFQLGVSGQALTMGLARLSFAGLPCPQWLLPRLVAEERGSEQQLHFVVSAALPLLGLVVSYRGHLDLPDAPP